MSRFKAAEYPKPCFRRTLDSSRRATSIDEVFCVQCVLIQFCCDERACTIVPRNRCMCHSELQPLRRRQQRWSRKKLLPPGKIRYTRVAAASSAHVPQEASSICAFIQRHRAEMARRNHRSRVLRPESTDKGNKRYQSRNGHLSSRGPPCEIRDRGWRTFCVAGARDDRHHHSCLIQA